MQAVDLTRVLEKGKRPLNGKSKGKGKTSWVENSGGSSVDSTDVDVIKKYRDDGDLSYYEKRYCDSSEHFHWVVCACYLFSFLFEG